MHSLCQPDIEYIENSQEIPSSIYESIYLESEERIEEYLPPKVLSIPKLNMESIVEVRSNSSSIEPIQTFRSKRKAFLNKNEFQDEQLSQLQT